MSSAVRHHCNETRADIEAAIASAKPVDLAGKSSRILSGLDLSGATADLADDAARLRQACRSREAPRLSCSGLVVAPDSFFNSRIEQLAALTVRHAVPVVFQWREFTAAGGAVELWKRHYRYIPSGRRLRRPDSQGRETGRLASPAGDESRVVYQSQDR